MLEFLSIWQELNANLSAFSMKMSLLLNMLQDLSQKLNRNTLRKEVQDLLELVASWVDSKMVSPICSLLNQVEHLQSGKPMQLVKKTRKLGSSLKKTTKITSMSNKLLDLP